MKITIHELAKKAGVSIATISRALNQETRDKVRPGTLERIDQLIQKYQYTPNVAAKNLRRASSNIIGVLLPHLPGIFMGDYYPKLLTGVSDALLETAYQFKMVMLKLQGSKWDKHDFRFGEGVDGLVITHWPLFFSDKSVFKKLGVPCVIINDPEEEIQAHYVSCDNEQGGEMVADYLFKQGHRKIAMITGPSWSSDSELRLKGFGNYFSKKGISLNPDLIISADFVQSLAYEKAHELLKRRKDFSAIFCLNDEMAFGVLRKMKEFGISCPEEVSIIGFDDQVKSSYTDPPLTTVYHPVYELAQAAAKILLDSLDEKKDKVCYKRETLPVHLVERSSVQKLK
jgi:LacI family transcriptional regulator